MEKWRSNVVPESQGSKAFTLANKCQALKKRQNPEDQAAIFGQLKLHKVWRAQILIPKLPVASSPEGNGALLVDLFFLFFSFFRFSLFFLFFLFFLFPPLRPPAPSFFILSAFSSPPSTFSGRSTLPSLLLATTICITYEPL